jgi:hypothetical protein
MKPLHIAAAATATAIALLAGAPASAAVTYNFTAFNGAAFTPPLGTVTVSGQGSNVLDFDVSLNSNVFFQLTNGSPHDDFWFDLTGLVGGNSVAYNITSPDGPLAGGGDYPTGGLFTGAAYSANHYGQGFLSGANYAVQDRDTSGGNDYYTGHLTFTVTAGAGSHLDLAPIDGGNIFAGADLRECVGGANGVCVTGPVGAMLAGGVPEPATWAMMIIGFGGVGAVLRQRRKALVVA